MSITHFVAFSTFQIIGDSISEWYLVKQFQISRGNSFRYLGENSFRYLGETVSDISGKQFQISRGNSFRFLGETVSDISRLKQELKNHSSSFERNQYSATFLFEISNNS